MLLCKKDQWYERGLEEEGEVVGMVGWGTSGTKGSVGDNVEECKGESGETTSEAGRDAELSMEEKQTGKSFTLLLMEAKFIGTASHHLKQTNLHPHLGINDQQNTLWRPWITMQICQQFQLLCLKLGHGKASSHMIWYWGEMKYADCKDYRPREL